MTYSSKRLAQEAARAAAEKKADDVEILDVQGTHDLADYWVLATADSSAQMKAVEESVENHLEDMGCAVLRRDGRASERWRVIDFGALVVHILHPEAREFYRLENMWDQPKRVAWGPSKPTRKSSRKRS